MTWFIIIGIIILVIIFSSAGTSKNKPKGNDDLQQIWDMAAGKAAHEEELKKTQLQGADEFISQKIKKLLYSARFHDQKGNTLAFNNTMDELEKIGKDVKLHGGQERIVLIRNRVNDLCGPDDAVYFCYYMDKFDKSYREKYESIGDQGKEDPGSQTYGMLQGTDMMSYSPKGSNTDAGPGGALYWFNWQKISDAGEKLYGAYVYRYILQFLSPTNLWSENMRCMIMDGDFLSSTQLDSCIPLADPTMVDVEQQGINAMYVIAIKGNEGFDYKRIDSRLKIIPVVGYVGMVALPPMNEMEFSRIGNSMALILAIKIEGKYLEKIDFELLGNSDIEQMGFKITK